MYLFKIGIPEQPELYSMYLCMSEEAKRFEREVEILCEKNSDTPILIADGNLIHRFENADKLKENVELVKLERSEYDTFCKFKIGNSECPAQKILDAILNSEYVLENNKDMKMEM